MNDTTRESLSFLREYWSTTAASSPFSEEQIGAIDSLFADPPSFSDEQWEDLFVRLEGPDGCNFREGPNGDTWDCKGGTDLTFTKAILGEMVDEAERDRVLSVIDVFGGHCDCEVVFNVQERVLGQ